MAIRSRDTTYYRKFPNAIWLISGLKGQPVITSGATNKYQAGQIIDSENHSWPPPKGAFGDFGGIFRNVKLYYDIPASYYRSDVNRNGPGQMSYSGPMTTPVGRLPTLSPLKLPALVNPGLEAKGATAISEVAPTNPHAQASTAIGELVKDGIPSIPGIHSWRDRALSLKNAGDEFLNVVFGWEPLVKDITDVSSAVSNASKLLKQYQRDGGKHVRRAFEFPIERSESSESFSGETAEIGCGTGSGNHFANTGNLAKLTIVKETISRIWYSGCFTYATPSDSTGWMNVLDAGDHADHLLGTAITPEVLWELTPWSWAIDWFTNVGDVMTNISAFKSAGLVMRYGYIMNEKVQKYTFTLDKSGLQFGPPPPPPAVVTYTTQQRMPANPFGFGIGWEGLSPLQLAITAALGITRLR